MKVVYRANQNAERHIVTERIFIVRYANAGYSDRRSYRNIYHGWKHPSNHPMRKNGVEHLAISKQHILVLRFFARLHYYFTFD